MTSDSGTGECFEAATGKVLWEERLGEQHASLVSGGGFAYFLNDQGVTNVVRPGPGFDLVARNELGERTFASPALSEGHIFIRGERHLFCIGPR